MSEEETRIALAKRTEELRESKAALERITKETSGDKENVASAMLQHRQILRGVVARAAAITGSSAPPSESTGLPIHQEISMLLTKTQSYLGTIESENREKSAAEKRKVEMFLQQLRAVETLNFQAVDPKEAAETKYKLVAAEAELGELQKRIADFQQWEKELGDLREAKLSLQAQLENFHAELGGITGNFIPKMRADLFELKRKTDDGEMHIPTLIKKDGSFADLAKIRSLVTAYVEDELRCRICLVAPMNILSLPCTHRVCCEGCISSLSSNCHRCGTAVTGKLGTSENCRGIFSAYEELASSVAQEVLDSRPVKKAKQ